MNILALFPQKEILDTVKFGLESKFAVPILVANNDKEGIKQFNEHHKNLDVVLLDGGSSTLEAFKVLYKSTQSAVPVIVCLKGQPQKTLQVEGLPILGIADYGKLLEDVLFFLGNITPKTKPETPGGDDASYCRINTNLLMKVTPLEAGVYIRLAANHYVMLFQKGDQFTVEDLQRYLTKKKLQYMYLKNEDTSTFVTKLNSELQELIKSNKLNLRAASELVQSSVDTVHELITQIGVNEEVEKLVSTNVAVSMKVMGEFPALGDILKRMKLEADQYISSHSMMCAHIACAIAVGMDWYSDATFQKLTIAAFMHDVALRDQKLCAVKSLTDLEKNYKGKFNTKEVQEYKTHPKKGALIVAQFKEIGADVDKIVMQHHEHPLGSGFPEALTATYITPLAAVFMIAHDIVDFAMDNNGTVDIDKYVAENENKFSSSHFKKILAGLANLQ